MNRREQPQALTPRTESIKTRGVAQSSLIAPASELRRVSPRTSNDLHHSVDLHIEQLVLHGFAPQDRYLIGDAVERELTRLLTKQHAPAITQDAETSHIDGGAFEITPGSNAETMGVQLAQVIYGGLDK